MAVPPLPTGLVVAFEPDAFVVELRARDLLVGPVGGAGLAGALLLTIALAVTTLGPLTGAALVLACVCLPALVVGLGYLVVALIELALAAPRRTRLRCDHEAIGLEILVHGMLRGHERIPLPSVRGCRVATEGLEILRCDGAPVTVPAERHSVEQLTWVAAVIEEAVRQRERFDRDEADLQPFRARVLALQRAIRCPRPTAEGGSRSPTGRGRPG